MLFQTFKCDVLTEPILLILLLIMIVKENANMLCRKNILFFFQNNFPHKLTLIHIYRESQEQ